MLKRSGLCVCFLLYWIISIYAEEDISILSTEKLQPHPRYLKEFFPFLQKEEESEEMRPLLMGIKRKRRVCHHGNMKRGSHIVRFRPSDDIKTLHFPDRAINFTRVSRIASDKGKHHIALTNGALTARKLREVSQGEKKGAVIKTTKKLATSKSTITTRQPNNSTVPVSQTTTKMWKTTRPSIAQNVTKHTSTTKKVKKRTEVVNKRIAARTKNYEAINKRAGPKSENDKTGIILSNTPFQSTFIPMMGLIKPADQSSIPGKFDSSIAASLKGRSLTPPHDQPRNRDPPNGSVTAVRDEFEEKEFAKRESKGAKSKKSVKSVITKILIIPVERQIEESGEEVPEEIDVVSLKHSRDNKKKHSTNRHKIASTGISATTSTRAASFSSTELDSTIGRTLRRQTSTYPSTALSLKGSPRTQEQRSTTRNVTTHKPPMGRTTARKPTNYRISRQTTKKRISCRGSVKPTMPTTTGTTSTVLSLSLSVSLAKEPDGESTSCDTTVSEQAEETVSPECSR